MIKRISHAALVVEDLGRSLDFYCEKLGFKKLFELSGEVEGHKFSTTYLQIAKDQYLAALDEHRQDLFIWDRQGIYVKRVGGPLLL